MNDHDTLIEIKTILKGVVEDFRAYRQSTHKDISDISTRIFAMEGNKVSIAEYVENKKENEIRLRRLEKAYWFSLGIIALIQFLAPFISDKFFQ